MKPDVIVVHPRTIVYPTWMNYMNKHQGLFNQIIVVMTNQGADKNIDNFLLDNLPKGITMIRTHDDQGDWRDRATNAGLGISISDRVLFMEQDFLMKPGFLERTLAYDNDVVGIKEASRFHPCFLLVKRAIIDKTSKDFSAKPPEYDHFGKFSRELVMLTSSIRWINSDGGFYHISGLTHNYTLDKIQHRRDDFLTYNKYCLRLPVPQYPPFVKLAEKYLDLPFTETEVKNYL